MTSKAHKIRVGLFTLIAAAMATFVLFVFGGLRLWGHRDHYRIVLSSSVMGLEEGAPVYVDGIKVGQVDDMAIARDDLRLVIVDIEVDRGAPVRRDTRAHLSLTGLTGLKAVELSGGTLAAPALPPGGTIAEGEAPLDKVQRAAQEIADHSKELVAKADKVMDNLSQWTDPARLAAIDDVLAQARVAAKNLAEASASMRTIGTPVQKVASDADALVVQLRTLVGANEGTLRAAMFDLRQATRSLKETAREVQQRPSRLLFSGAPKDRALP
jgi:phospholipid/cholesterol/gamma-HCH transport system substrate-binding protein